MVGVLYYRCRMYGVDLMADVTTKSVSGATTLRRPPRVGRFLGRGVLYGIIFLGAFIIAVPFLWMLSTSLSPKSQIALFNIQWIPHPITWQNYPLALHDIPVIEYAQNTLVIAFFNLLGTLVSSYLVAYGFARLRFPGRSFFFGLLLSTMMLPGIVILIPQFIEFQKLGWLNTFKPLIIPAYFGGGAFYVFLLRQFMMTIPQELSDAALIDGAGFMMILWRVIVPLTKPALAVVAIFNFMANWNDIMGPLIFLNSPSKYTLAVGIAMFRGTWGILSWNHMMAATVMFAIPPLLLFFCFQRTFVEGVVMTGLKA